MKLKNIKALNNQWSKGITHQILLHVHPELFFGRVIWALFFLLAYKKEQNSLLDIPRMSYREWKRHKCLDFLTTAL